MFSKTNAFRDMVTIKTILYPDLVTYGDCGGNSRLFECHTLRPINDGLLGRLQSVQNTAARLVTGARRRDHATPLLKQLHWLPVRHQVVFKIAGLVYQSLAGVALLYLADDSLLLSECGRCSLQCSSNDIRTLVVPRTHTNSATHVFQLLAHDCGTILHENFCRHSCRLTFSGITWRRHCSNVALSDFLGAIHCVSKKFPPLNSL